jgi:hypothetical protein
MNATNNLALAQRGTVVVNHDNKAMNEQATKQDLHNQGIQIDSEFVKVDSQLVILRTDMNAGFDRVDGQFTNLRTDMDAKFTKVDSQITNLRTDMDSQFVKLRAEISEQFSKVYVLIEKSKSETRALLSKSTAANTLLMVAILSIDRWWR